MKFTIIHPSRTRCEIARQSAHRCIERFDISKGDTLEYILSLDNDDHYVSCYQQWADEYGIHLIVNQNRSLVDACNNGALISTGDCLIVLSDDFETPENWNTLLKEKIGENDFYGILINDGISAASLSIMSLPILSRKLYLKLGYLYHPDFFSLYADNALLDVCIKLDCLIDARDLVFQHHHYSVGLSKHDATYARENSRQAHNMGVNAYEALKARNYDL